MKAQLSTPISHLQGAESLIYHTLKDIQDSISVIEAEHRADVTTEIMAYVMGISRGEVIGMIRRKAWTTGAIPEFVKVPGRKGYLCPRANLLKWMKSRLMPAQERVIARKQRG